MSSGGPPVKHLNIVLILTLLALFASACSDTAPAAATAAPTSTAAQNAAVVPVPTETAAPVPTSSPLPSVAPTLVEPTTAPENTATEPAAIPSSPTPTAVPTQDCSEKVGYFGDVTVPDHTAFNQGDTFTKTWRVRNEGTCHWGDGYQLVFFSGDLMGAPESNPIPAAAPGDIIDISVDMAAPLSAGSFVGNWEFESPDGKRFGLGASGGAKLWVLIGVRMNQQASQPVIQPTQGSQPVPTATAEPSLSTVPGSCGAQQDSGNESQVLALINQARADNGLPALALDNLLTAAALAHSLDMACQDFVDHTGSDGSSWYDRITAQGYQYKSASENLYVGNPAFGGTPQGAYDWWMSSQIHRDAILNPDFEQVGIAYVFFSGSTYGGHFTVVFAEP